MRQTIFQRLGGFARVRLLVSEFYERILDSPLRGHFDGIDMGRLIDHQTRFIASVMGGPASFTEEQLRRAHAHLRITADEFGLMAELLRDSLEDFGLEDADVLHICSKVFSFRDAIVVSTGAGVP